MFDFLFLKTSTIGEVLGVVFGLSAILTLILAMLLSFDDYGKYRKLPLVGTKTWLVPTLIIPLSMLIAFISLFIASAQAKQTFPLERLVFAGKVVNENSGEWPNERLVLLFLKNREIGRDITELKEFAKSGQGVTDGVFIIQANNDYKLTLGALRDDSIVQEARLDAATDTEEQQVPRLFGPRTEPVKFTYLHYWFDEIEEGALQHIPVRYKNTEYVIKVLEGNAMDLPASIQSGPLELKDDGTLIVPVADVPYGEAVGNAIVESVTYSAEPEFIQLSKLTIPIDNCGGSASITQRYEHSQVFVHEYREERGARIGVEIPLLAWFGLIGELEARHGFIQGQVNSQTIEYTMMAESGTNQVYIITWKEKWESGVAEVVLENNIVSVPFRAKTDLIYEIESEEREC